MSLRVYAFTCGTVTAEFARLMEGAEGDITVPIPVFLIEHPKGKVMFDTGLHPDCQPDPAGRLGERLADAFEQANRAHFSSGALQWQVSIALCRRGRRLAVAKAGERHDADRKTGGSRRIPVKAMLA